MLGSALARFHLATDPSKVCFLLVFNLSFSAALQTDAVSVFTKKLIQDGLEGAICTSIEEFFGESSAPAGNTMTTERHHQLLFPLSEPPVVLATLSF